MAQDYTYIVARLRALEAEMPDAGWFQRLVRTPVDGILPMVREHFHGFDQVESLAGIETGLEAERKDFIDLLTRLLSESETVLFLRAGYDFDNALHAWKAAQLGREPVLTSAGLVEPEIVSKGVTEGGRGILPEHIASLVETLEERAERGGLTAAQYAGEAEKYRFLLGIAPGNAARDYTRRRIDLSNIGTLIRLKRTSLRAVETGNALLEGGMIGRDRFVTLLGEPEEELYSFLHFSEYRRLLRWGLDQETALWKMEDASMRYLLEALEESRLRFFDLSCLLYHVELRARNESVTRTILVGKSNGIPEERILERVETALS